LHPSFERCGVLSKALRKLADTTEICTLYDDSASCCCHLQEKKMEVDTPDLTPHAYGSRHGRVRMLMVSIKSHLLLFHYLIRQIIALGYRQYTLSEEGLLEENYVSNLVVHIRRSASVEDIEDVDCESSI